MNNIEIDLKKDNIENDLENKQDVINIELEKNEKINMRETTNNYNDLKNKPTLNDVTIEGKKKSLDYNLQDKMDRIKNSDIEEIFKDF